MNKNINASVSDSDMAKVEKWATPIWQKKQEQPQMCNNVLFIGNNDWSLALDMQTYGLKDYNYGRMNYVPVPIVFSARYRAVRRCTMLVDDLRTQVLDIIKGMANVDMVKFPHAYPYQLARSKGAVVLEDKKIPISLMEHATRLMLLAGMTAVDVDIEDMFVSFVGRCSGKPFAAVTIATSSFSEHGENRPVLGSICLHPVEFECNKAEVSVLHHTIMSIVSAAKYLKDERMGMCNLYAVDLVKSHTAYVLANDQHEAGEIARKNAYNCDFSDACQVEDISDIDYIDIEGTGCDVFTEEDVITEKKLLDYGFADDYLHDEEEDEEE